MSAETYSNADVIRFSNERFISVRLNVDDKKDLAKRFGVKVTPGTYLVDLDVEIVERIEGYFAPKDYLPRLKRVDARFQTLAAAIDAAKLKPGDLKTERLLADAVRGLGKYAKAIGAYRKLLESLAARQELSEEERRERAQIRTGLLDASMRSGAADIEDQIKILRQEDADNKFDTLDDALAAEALIRYSRKDFEAAAAMARDGYAKYPRSDKAGAFLYLSAMICVETGKKEQGIKTLRELVQKFPDTEAGELGRQALAALE